MNEIAGWQLDPGDQIRRRELHDRLGGRRQGGIGPSLRSPNVFVFSEEESCTLHGYRDGWGDDGLFHYTGEGQKGDQRIRAGNKAVASHLEDRRALRLFEGVGGTVTYIGEFRYVDHYFEDAPQTGDNDLRKVIVFRLMPLDSFPLEPSLETAASPRVEVVDLEGHHTDEFAISPNAEPTAGMRREQPLVVQYAAKLRSEGLTIKRHRYRLEHGRSLYCDAFIEDTRALIESKSSATRGCVRMGIGQLLDYALFEERYPESLVLLLPSEPRQDLIRLLHHHGIDVVYQEGDRWVELRPAV